VIVYRFIFTTYEYVCSTIFVILVMLLFFILSMLLKTCIEI
jgi:hypothetical protein